MGQVTK